MNVYISLFYIIPTLFIFLLVFPMIIEVRVSYNLIDNKGAVALFIFKKQLFYYIISFHGSYIRLENKKQTKIQNLKFSDPKFAIVEKFGKQIKDKIKLKKVYAFYNIGIGDAFESAMLCGLINQILMHFFLYLKNQKPTASLCVYDTISYNIEMFEVACRAQISVSFFDVVYSYLNSVIIINKK